MTKQEKTVILKNRINTLENRGMKNVKAPGVLKKLYRQLRKVEAEI